MNFDQKNVHDLVHLTLQTGELEGIGESRTGSGYEVLGEQTELARLINSLGGCPNSSDRLEGRVCTGDDYGPAAEMSAHVPRLRVVCACGVSRTR